jgi:hypothetical protein
MKMKAEIDCVRAHDLIVGILLDEELHSELDPEMIQRMSIAADAMCWVLGHTHNHCFQDNLDKFEAFAREHGFELKYAKQ